MRTAPIFAALLVLATAGACSLAIDATDIDEGCADGEKRCDDKCVLISDPAYGCQPDVCTPCRFARAIPFCNTNDECEVETCLEGFCGPDCETNMLSDENNCGGCGSQFACLDAQTCREGQCVPR